MKSLLAVLLICTFSSTAFAQPVVTFPPGDDKIVTLKQGEPAPFSGQLFDAPTAIRWGNWLQQYQLRLKVDVEMQKKIDGAQLAYLNEVIKLERDQYKIVTTDYQLRLQKAEDEARNPIWYRTPAFGAVLGVAGTLAAVAIGVAIVNAGSK